MAYKYEIEVTVIGEQTFSFVHSGMAEERLRAMVEMYVLVLKGCKEIRRVDRNRLSTELRRELLNGFWDEGCSEATSFSCGIVRKTKREDIFLQAIIVEED